MSRLLHVPLSAIQPDSITQVRVAIDNSLVAEYAEKMAQGIKLPPIDLFLVGESHLIGDGWHRFLAAQKNGDVTIHANVHEGGRTEAIKFALGANASHGARRTNADKRRAVEIALREFSEMSDRAIAEMCGVSPTTVSSARPRTVSKLDTAEKPATRIGRDGVRQPATKPKKLDYQTMPIADLRAHIDESTSAMTNFGATAEKQFGRELRDMCQINEPNNTLAPVESIADSPIVHRAMAALSEACGSPVEAVKVESADPAPTRITRHRRRVPPFDFEQWKDHKRITMGMWFRPVPEALRREAYEFLAQLAQELSQNNEQ